MMDPLVGWPQTLKLQTEVDGRSYSYLFAKTDIKTGDEITYDYGENGLTVKYHGVHSILVFQTGKHF